MYEFWKNQILVDYELRNVRFDNNYPIKYFLGGLETFPWCFNAFWTIWSYDITDFELLQISADQLQISL